MWRIKKEISTKADDAGNRDRNGLKMVRFTTSFTFWQQQKGSEMIWAEYFYAPKLVKAPEVEAAFNPLENSIFPSAKCTAIATFGWFPTGIHKWTLIHRSVTHLPSIMDTFGPNKIVRCGWWCRNRNTVWVAADMPDRHKMYPCECACASIKMYHKKFLSQIPISWRIEYLCFEILFATILSCGVFFLFAHLLRLLPFHRILFQAVYSAYTPPDSLIHARSFPSCHLKVFAGENLFCCCVDGGREKWNPKSFFTVVRCVVYVRMFCMHKQL